MELILNNPSHSPFIMKLWQYVARRLILLIPVVIGVTLITFTVSHVIPANPARAWAGQKAPPEVVKKIAEKYHLNDPLYMQYYYYLSGLVKGDWGYSHSEHRPVTECLSDYFPATFELTLWAMIIAIPLGIYLGVISAVKRNKLPDHLSRVFALSGVSMPIFWLGLLLILLFYSYLGILPASGRGISPSHTYTGLYILDSILSIDGRALIDDLRHIILPAITLSYATLAVITRMTRSSMLEVLRLDYIKTARAKGLPNKVVIYRHALRNAMIPTLTVSGLAFAGLLGGAVLTETIFSWPGMGRYAYHAISTLDFPAIMGVTFLMAVIFVIANLIVDILYAYLDPRIKLGE